LGKKEKGAISFQRCLDNSDNTVIGLWGPGVSTPAAPAVATQDIFESQFLLDLLVVFLLSASQPRYKKPKSGRVWTNGLGLTIIGGRC